MKDLSCVTTTSGESVYTFDYISEVRKRILDKQETLKITAQAGAQERMLAIDADIKICGGSRGGSKSFSLLLEGKYDVRNKDFHGILLRNESKDLDSLITDSYKVFSQDGDYNKSVNDMTWNFYNGGWLKFSYYTGAFEDFKTRFQGRQYSFIGIDEITQMPYKKFKYLITNNRNASGLRNRIWGTCNPDPDSWVRKFIDWWIGDDGYPIQERDGVVRYLYMNGDRPDDIYWGNTKEEVYEQCKDIIDGLWSEEYDKLGYDKLDMFIKSATFIRADLSENILLTSTDKSYFGNLAQQDEEQRMRDLKGNWNWRNAGDDMIKADDMERMFNNAEKQDDGTRYASCDIAFTGGDNLVMWLWIGHHVQDLCVLRVKSDTAISAVKAKLSEWGVKEENFTYDMQGIGQSFQGFFRNATPFNNQGTPIAKDWSEEKGIRFLYKDLKSQCAWLFAQDIKNGEYRTIATPGEIATIVADGHTALVQKGAGERCGFSDEAYEKAGAELVGTMEEIYARADFVTKVKEFEPCEYGLIRENQIVFTCIHPAAHPAEVDALLKSKCIAFTAEDSHRYGSPNCEAAGKQGALFGLESMLSTNGGKGKFVGGLAGAPGMNVVILGGGIVGKSALQVLHALGAHCTVFDINIGTLRALQMQYGDSIDTALSTRQNIAKVLPQTDHETTHENPRYVEEGVVHFCVSNIPGAIAQSTSISYAASVIGHFRSILNNGVAEACVRDGFLRRSLTCYKGLLTHEETSALQNKPWIRPEDVLGIADRNLDPAPPATVTRSSNFYKK